MGLITLVFLLAFTVFYLSKALPSLPAWAATAVAKISENIDKISLWGAGYGLLCAVLTLVMTYSGGEMLIRLTANILVVLMALPSAFDQLLAKFKDKVNPVIAEEAGNLVSWVGKQERNIAYISVAFSLMLFAILFT